MLYTGYEMQKNWLAGASTMATMSAAMLKNPGNMFGYMAGGPVVASALEVFAHAAAPRGKPAFGLERIETDGRVLQVHEEIVLQKPFGQLKRFTHADSADKPKLLIVAPMSGHFATLLRGTVERMIPDHEVYVTDWRDAKGGSAVRRPLRSGRLYRLSDRIYGAYRPARAHACGVPAVRALPCHGRADVGGQASVPPAHAHDDGGAYRYARGAHSGQYHGDAAAAQLVQPECHCHRTDAISRRGPKGLSRFFAAGRFHVHEPGRASQQPLGNVQTSGRWRRRRRGCDQGFFTTNIARSPI